VSRVLVTGGAGFIGSFLVDELVQKGHEVIVIDSLEDQVHHGVKPDYLNRTARYVWSDCSDRAQIARALDGVDVVFHLAALVGVGQSMYEIARYTSGNTLATAILAEEIRKMARPLRKVIVASSMSVYGEGAYRDGDGQVTYPTGRPAERLKNRLWEMVDEDGRTLEPIPTSEDKPLRLTSVYALGKQYQEDLMLLLGRAFDIPTVACRFFNCYGSRQALNNPYTGVAAIFCGRLLQGLPPVIFEDGRQIRDFVHVSDLVRALILCMERDEADGQVLNIGSGRPVTVTDVARILSVAISGGAVEPSITGQFRAGDIRHCYADITKARRLIGYEPRWTFESGVDELIEWVGRQTMSADAFEAALTEARARGVVSCL
jgi:dTDP-L-rhamnose 4-epimerase